MRRERLSQAEFSEIVELALTDIPSEFLDLLENVAVTVEDEPTDDDLDSVDLEDDDSELLGLFRGVPLVDHAHDLLPDMPTQIVIFRGPLLRVCDSPEELLEEIRDTVIHELGHYFGLDDHEMEY